jgi:hypothetical protein
MKPGSGDYRHKLVISGDELRELQRHTYMMAEAFGLDRRIENYKGTRPITLYRWDLECLLDVIDLVIRDKDKRDSTGRRRLPVPDVPILTKLKERLQREHDAVYGGEVQAQVEQPKGKLPKVTRRAEKSPPQDADEDE